MTASLFTQPFTPDIARNPESVTLCRGYLVEVTEGYGCGGIEGTVHVFLDEDAYRDTHNLSGLAPTVKKVKDSVDAILAAELEERREQAGPRPEWNDDWKGTRSEYDAARKEYDGKARNTLQRDEVVAQEWLKHDGTVITVKYPVWSVNELERYDEEKHGVRCVAFHTEHGCRCMGSNRWNLFDEGDENLVGEKGHEELTTDMFIAPLITMVTVNDEFVYLVDESDIDETRVRSLLRDLADEWTERELKRVTRLAEARTELAALITKEELEKLPFDEYQARKDEPNKRWGLNNEINNLMNKYGGPLDAIDSPLRMTLPGIEARSEYGWLRRHTTIGNAWIAKSQELVD